MIPSAKESESAHDAILRVAKELGLTMAVRFVPWSQSRNKGEKTPSLNWEVSLARGLGPAILTTDYMAGSGHCPAYKASVKRLGGHNSLMRSEAIAWECEHGKPAHVMEGLNHITPIAGAKPIEPDLADVLYSLVMDASVLDHKDFESWASEYGYDADSRTAEKTYHACLDIALKLRNGIGEQGLEALQTACQDY